jgi:putative DNA primase/helicase
MPADTLRTAAWLVDQRGFSVIPLDHPGESTETVPARIGKVPALKWRRYQTTKPTPEDLQTWFGNGHLRNIGVVTGEVSQIVVVDLDSARAVAWADTHLPPTPMATRTAKGEHRYYRHPGVPVRNQARMRTDGSILQIDLRADGGYAVGPGSLHASGVVYERLGAWPPVDQLPTFDPAWLEPEEEDAPSAAAPGTAPMPRPVATDDHARVLTRARAYLAAIPGAVQGQGGDTQTLTAACRVVRGFDLDDADALDLLRTWNQTCTPPWSDEDLTRKIHNARQYGTEPIGGLRDTPRREGSPSSRRTAAGNDTRKARQTRRAEPVPEDHPTTGGETSTDETGLDANRFHRTDAGNAEFFAAREGASLRFDHQRRQWLVWTGHRWQPDADAEVHRRAKAAIRARLRDGARLADDDKRKHAVKWALDSEGRSRLEALVRLAQAEAPLAEAGGQWDRDPWLLGVPNGVLDLRTGLLRAGQREDRITMVAGVPFDAEAPCPRWERFIHEIVGHDADLAAFLQRAVGYSLTGLTTEQCLFLNYGQGGNGKSTFLKTVKVVLGEYAANTPFGTFELHARAGIPNDLAALRGRRFVVAAETNDGNRLNEARVKALTGDEPITARFLHGEFFEFSPVCKIWLAVNHRPVVRDDSHGFWRRIRLIPFTQTFPTDPTVGHTLAQELPGILAWAVRGCLVWQTVGLTPPAVVDVATQQYARDSDPLADFLAEACEPQPGAEVRAKEMFEHYDAWAAHARLSNYERLGSTRFGRKLAERVERVERKTGNVYLGLARRDFRMEA